MYRNRSPLLVLALAGLGGGRLGARGLGLAERVGRLLDQLKVLCSRVGAASGSVVERLIIGVNLNIVGDFGRRRRHAKSTTNSAIEGPNRETNDGGVLESGCLELVGLCVSVSNRNSHERVPSTHVKEEGLQSALVILFLEIHIASEVDNQDLAVLGNDTLAGPSRVGLLGRCLLRCSSAASATLLALDALVLAGGGLLHAPLAAIHRLRSHLLVIIGSGRGRSRSRVDARNAEVIAPGLVACELDVSLDEVPVLLMVHVEDEVVDAAADEEEDTEHGSSEARAIPIVVVVASFPGGETVGKEVIIAITLGTAQDLANKTEASLAIHCNLHGSIDLLLRERLDVLALLLRLVALALELLLDLVGVEGSGDFAIGLGDFVNGGTLANANELIEGEVGVLPVGLKLIADAEDFAVWSSGQKTSRRGAGVFQKTYPPCSMPPRRRS